MVKDLGDIQIEKNSWEKKWLPSNVLKFVMAKRDKVYTVKSPGINRR